MLFLVGMPASGKSTLGKQIAQKWNAKFVDLDEEIVAFSQKAISEIFSQKGEEHFRKIEAEVLRKVSVEPCKVIATGGGTPCFYQNIDYMLSVGKVVFLDTPLSVISERVLQTPSQRPMFAGKNTNEILVFLCKLYQERLPFYERAHFRIHGLQELENLRELLGF